jgi:tetratricopeptide (TPR) repeat protein
MREVVRALKRDHRRVRFGAVLACTALAGGAFGAWTMHHPAADACADAPVHRAVMWNESVRAGVKSGLAGAPWTARTIAAFDDASRSWELSYRTVCEATRVHGGQSDALLELRMRCLDRSLDRLGALATALAGTNDARALPDAPADAVSNRLDAAARAAAPSAVASLPQPVECETLSDPAELALPAEPQQREHARAAEHELDRGWAAFALGHYADAKQIAASATAQLAALDAPAVRAAALVLDAAVEARTGTFAAAHARLQAALDAAAAAHSGALELDVWARMLRTELFAGDPAHVVEWAPFARAAAARAGRQGAELDGIVAEAERDAGHLKAAQDLVVRALASSDPLRPDQRAILELDLGAIQLAAGDSTAATATLTRARDRVIGAVGDRHPDLALYDDKLAAALRARGKLRDALALHDRSAQLRTAAFGAADRAVATSVFHRAESELEAGELAKAEHSLHQAIAIRSQIYGDTSARLGELYAALGDCDLARGDKDGAREHYARAVWLDPRLDPKVSAALVAREVDAGMTVPLDAIPPLAASELLSTDRAGALAARSYLLMQALAPGEVGPIGEALHARYRPDLDPQITVAIARAWFAGGHRKEAAELFATALARDGNEPSRTALEAAVGLAQCDDPRAGQAARTAISLYQAMPQLGRASYPLMQELAKLP